MGVFKQGEAPNTHMPDGIKDSKHLYYGKDPKKNLDFEDCEATAWEISWFEGL